MDAAAIPYKFATPWAADATSGYITTTIPATATGAAASQQLGFPPLTATPVGSGGSPPNVADFNGLGLYATSWLQWLQAGGPVGYDSTLSSAIGGYPKGALLASATFGKYWLSTADNNASDPDTGGGNWIPVPYGFGTQFLSATTSTSWTTAASGAFINAGGSTTTQTVPAASAVAGMTIGFYAVTACTIATAGGSIYLDGIVVTTVSMTADSFLCLQSDGTNWRCFSGSPGLLGYAKLNGSTSQVFHVANAAASTEAVALGQFSYSATGSDDSLQIGPDGKWLQTYQTAVSCGGGTLTTNVTLPNAFPSAMDGATVAFYGTTPPGASNPGSIGAEPVSNSVVAIGTNFANSGTLGIIITAWGH